MVGMFNPVVRRLAAAALTVLILAPLPSRGDTRLVALVNGVKEIYLTPRDKVEFEIGVEGREETAEWWVAIFSPFGWFSYNMKTATWHEGLGSPFQGEVKDFTPTAILSISGLPKGDYYLFFALDHKMDGIPGGDSLKYDFATLHVREIWRPEPGTTWQWQLTGPLDLSINAQVYDVDLFETPKETIERLHNMGRKVICYLNAGSWESWRPDASKYPESILGKELEGWEGERWIDIREISLLAPILEARLDLAVEKGCDGIEPDNIDGYTNETGFPLTERDQLLFNRWISLVCHKRGLSVGLKNDLAQVDPLLPFFDWALNESCFQYNECEKLLPFVKSGKAVFGVEYAGDPDQFCPQANAMGFSWMKKHLNLDAWREACWERE